MSAARASARRRCRSLTLIDPCGPAARRRLPQTAALLQGPHPLLLHPSPSRVAPAADVATFAAPSEYDVPLTPLPPGYVQGWPRNLFVVRHVGIADISRKAEQWNTFGGPVLNIVSAWATELRLLYLGYEWCWMVHLVSGLPKKMRGKCFLS